MKRLFSTAAALVLALALIGGAGAVVIWVLTSVREPVRPLIAGALAFVASRYYESLKESRSRLYERKREAYATMLRPWRDVMSSIIQNRGSVAEISVTPSLAASATDAGFDGILYASDDVLRRYVAFRNVGVGREATSSEVLGRLGALLMAMRRDLGHPFSSLDEVDVIATFVNMSDQERAQFRSTIRASRR
jgi:hypothetical protein